jgi:gamma-glutamylcyclotransferase (GGCT)/AIG2-like uncharacterized protein YtfP
MTTVKIKSGDWEVEATTTKHFEYPSGVQGFITTAIDSAVKNYVEPKSAIKQSDLDIKDNQIMLLKEDLEVVHMYLDGLLVPRKDDNGETYSIVGRIKQFENEMVKQISNLESIYLEEQSKMYTESEVEKHLETQRGNCWVAAEQGGMDKIMEAPEPGNWRKINNN